MLIEPVPIRTRASAGGSGEGVAERGRPTRAERGKRAGIMLLVGLGVALLFLPIPLIHLFGLFFFLVVALLAGQRLMTGAVLRSARGTCGSCGREGRYFVGLGWRPFRLPVKTSCPHCAIALTLEAPGPPSPV